MWSQIFENSIYMKCWTSFCRETAWLTGWKWCEGPPRISAHLYIKLLIADSWTKRYKNTLIMYKALHVPYWHKKMNILKFLNLNCKIWHTSREAKQTIFFKHIIFIHHFFILYTYLLKWRYSHFWKHFEPIK